MLIALRSLAAARSFGMAILLVIAILSIAGQQISGIVYTPGGGLGLPFMQYYPGPAPSPAGVEEAISLYTIWSASPKTEPLPQVADFILDRITLGRIGNISIQAPRIRRVIACSPRSVKLQSVDNTQRAIVSYEVETKYSLRKFSEIHTGTSKPWPIRVRQQPGLTSWIHEATMLSPTRSNMTVIFGSFNDHIENSSTVEVSGNTNFSALACNIDIELQDDTAIIGHLNAPRLTSISQNLGSVTNLTNSFFLPVWLGAATTFIGGSVAGLQPTYGKDPSGWPSPRYTSYGSVEGWNNSAVWSISDITEFMDHSQSALAQGIAGSWRDKDDVLMLDSEFSDLRISSYRTYILLLPVGILIATCIGLLATNTLMHRQTDIFGMQTAELSLLIYRTQNVTYLQKKAEVMTAEEFSMLQVQLHKGNDSVYLSTPASISS
ncbi:hypothetical protein FOXYS1_13605 [Fusarium oxysporum]|uniref:Transmembrane protein n=1 Tax=Fusarium oxysporum TaxID=5507 RepID=A0A8H5A359_FUSOX|nr:hypothetical protein FOXYS1_13605 [Fusarium oxysporum]